MTAEERRYIIYEHELHEKTFRSIAKEMGITPQAITNDRRRHRDEWERETEWLNVQIKYGLDKVYGKMINIFREKLPNVLSLIKEVDEQRQKAIRAAPDVRPDFLAKILKANKALAVELAKCEKSLYVLLAILLEKKYGQS